MYITYNTPLQHEAEHHSKHQLRLVYCTNVNSTKVDVALGETRNFIISWSDSY